MELDAFLSVERIFEPIWIPFPAKPETTTLVFSGATFCGKELGSGTATFSYKFELGDSSPVVST